MKQDSKAEKLSKQVVAACVSDPLNEATPLINAPKAETAAVVAIEAPAADVATTGVAADVSATENLTTAR